MVSAAQRGELGAHVHLQVLEEVMVLETEHTRVTLQSIHCTVDVSEPQRGSVCAHVKMRDCVCVTSCEVKGTKMPMPPDRVV